MFVQLDTFLVRGNVIENSGNWGISFYPPSVNGIVENNVVRNLTGASCAEADNCAGMTAWNNSDTLFRNNLIFGMSRPHTSGILFLGGSGNSLYNNTITGASQYGVYGI